MYFMIHFKRARELSIKQLCKTITFLLTCNELHSWQYIYQKHLLSETMKVYTKAVETLVLTYSQLILTLLCLWVI